MKTVIKRALLILSMTVALVATHPSVTGTSYAINCMEDKNKTFLGIPTWYKHLQVNESEGKCRPVVDEVKDALPIGLAVFEMALTAAGIVAVVMIFIGSIKFILSQGESESTAGARKTVINAAIGLAITLVAARVVSFIAGRLGN